MKAILRCWESTTVIRQPKFLLKINIGANITILSMSKWCVKVSAARAASFFFFIQPMRSLFSVIRRQAKISHEKKNARAERAHPTERVWRVVSAESVGLASCMLITQANLWRFLFVIGVVFFVNSLISQLLTEIRRNGETSLETRYTIVSVVKCHFPSKSFGQTGILGNRITFQLMKQTHCYVHVDLISWPTARKHDRSTSSVQCTSEFRISLVHLSRAWVASVKFQIIDSPISECLQKERKTEQVKQINLLKFVVCKCMTLRNTRK